MKLSDKVRDLLAYAREEDPYAENKLRAILADVEALEAHDAAVVRANSVLVERIQALEGENHRLDKYYDEKSARINDLEFLMEQQTLGHAEVVRALETECDREAGFKIACWDQLDERGTWVKELEAERNEYKRRLDVMGAVATNAKIEAYEDAKMVCDSSDTLTIRMLQARIDALKAGENK